ncbi:dephospho-CoA kinase [Paraglaciecola aquimarina]|uniref:Dephospho-CoA kinase n=1 Tax=Paraglaciecola algarum TaxID=3050085 RepID=A0ABS9D8G1_9ALTE|nr:dephospho-CoA kinase [Paraglaciecola sp. G1-23]
MSDYVVGVSGGIGSGKTTVTDLFAQKNIEVIDADVIARQVVEPNTPALNQIVKKFGPNIVNSQGQLDRAQLRKLIFAKPELKNWLNDLLHPLIRQQMLEQTQQAKSVYCLLSVPLLVENNLVNLVDRVLIVDVEEQVQIQRSVLRDNSNEQQIRAIMQAQVSREERLKVADDVIDNNHDLGHLIPQIDKLHLEYLALADLTK